MKLAIAGDSAGLPLAKILADHLRQRDDLVIEEISDPPEGQTELYASLAERVAQAVRAGTFDRAILCCGTGIGVAIAANKVPGIRAAQVHDTYSAERAALSNDAQIITMGARVIGPELAKAVVEAWLAQTGRFDPQSHSAANVRDIEAVDARYRRG
ncbi:RpiB/LacA/LacB family sugar-phosphate isomerase [Rubellimicrobium sp. CFH 75288]|uniref:D-erythrulose-4-phosphate isomerase n=1 Tax=Rubellimicrobium sp. CFH 75288 TaxID=2697034 RepID=UPI0014135887|nr:RpiB/LacA/LacB family sugar-phosphate isomerase [Rubellimicrobium sp. CFH 75288]NAZ36360.1 RpiB/LacA/LacB family sugar-phosphate isomerase [Rubellimicrobium sp. CFH 75288]